MTATAERVTGYQELENRYNKIPEGSFEAIIDGLAGYAKATNHLHDGGFMPPPFMLPPNVPVRADGGMRLVGEMELYRHSGDGGAASLKNTPEDFKSKLKELTDKRKNIIAKYKDDVSGILKKFRDKVENGQKSNPDDAADQIDKAAKDAKKKDADTIDETAREAKKALRDHPDFVTTIVAAFKDAMNFFVNLWNTIKNAIMKAIEWVRKAFNDVIEWIKKAWNNAVNWVEDKVGGAIDSVKTWWETTFG